MKALFTAVVVAVILGVLLGGAVAYVEVPPALVQSPDDVLAVSSQAAEPVATAKAELPETVFEFGNIERGTSMSHEFVIRNVGNKPLQVEVESTTCKCTVGDLADKDIEPGGETKVLLEWVAKTPPGPFRHGAVLSTNDPSQRSLELTVEGQVVESTAMYPPELFFGTMRAGDTKQVSLHLMQFLDEEVKVLDYKLSDEELAEQIKIDIAEADPKDLPTPGAVAGVKLTATYAAGKSVGPFQCWLDITTNLENAETLTVPIGGNVVGDVSIFHPAWNAQKGLLRMGSIASKEGKKATLTVAVRGKHDVKTQLEVASVDPPQLQASLGEPRQMGENLQHIPLVLEVPAGSDPVVRLGEPVSSDAHVVLKSNDGKIPEVRLRIQLVVE